MPSTISLIQRLKSDYPQFVFKKSDRFLWSPSDRTVFYSGTNSDNSFLLHELSHGLLGHAGYNKDIELISMERAAWDRAASIASTYDDAIDEDTIESTLDSYREWLHARSTCPHCKATGLQVKKQVYHCPACQHSWRVNEARICGLKRTDLSIQ